MGSETFYDYDNCEYIILRQDSEPDTLKFGFSCNCYKQIMDNGGQDMLDELYKENILPKEKSILESKITLGIDCSGLAKTQSKFPTNFKPVYRGEKDDE